MFVKTKIIITALIVLIVVGLLGVIVYSQSRYNSMVVHPNAVPSAAPTPSPDPDRPFSVLLLGYGGGAHDGTYLTDSMILALVKPHQQTVDLISIPRDLWVEMPVGETAPYFSKINQAYSIGLDTKKFQNRPGQFTGDAGGGEMAKAVVADVTGIKPDYFVAVDFSGFTEAIDELGGVDVNVATAFTDPKYPLEDKVDDTCGKSPSDVQALTATMSGDLLENQFPCRYEVLTFKKGITRMDGATALKYVRSRHSTVDGGDFNRAARQRQFLLAVKDKVVSLNFFSKAIPLLNTLTTHIRTDIDLATMENFIGRGPGFAQYKIISVPLTDQNVLADSWSGDKQAILIPTGGIGQYAQVQSFITADGITPTPTLRPTRVIQKPVNNK